ncbi:MAG TPA: S1/P1 nuclease [Bacteroidia bacterium]|nr:S1/P1 nuclease [Bacteroidia bacterium]
MKRVVLIAILFSAGKLSAWSKEGHYLIAEIARHYLKPAVLDSVQHFLGDMSLEEASDWMDAVRKEGGQAYMNPWHYANIAKDKTYVPVKSPDVINRLQLAVKNLKTNRNDPAGSQFYIKVLLHLLGDLHQPLHLGYAEDKGGNDVEVQYFNRLSNLHRVWDDLLIKTAKIEGETCLHHLNALDKDVQNFDGNSFLKWAMESRALLSIVYDFKDGLIDQNYVNKVTPLIEIQLLKAGMRVAAVLNSIYG